MAFGYRQYNTSGYIQVDDNYPNLRVIASGTASTTTTVYFPYTGDIPIVTVGKWSQDAFLYVSTFTNNYFSMAGFDSSGYPVTFPYRVYAQAGGLPAASGFGLRVNNSSGQATFDSNYSYQGVGYYADITSMIQYYNILTIQSITHYVGGDPYIVINPFFVTIGQQDVGYDPYENVSYAAELVLAFKNTDPNTMYFTSAQSGNIYSYYGGGGGTSSWDRRVTLTVGR